MPLKASSCLLKAIASCRGVAQASHSLQSLQHLKVLRLNVGPHFRWLHGLLRCAGHELALTVPSTYFSDTCILSSGCQYYACQTFLAFDEMERVVCAVTASLLPGTVSPHMSLSQSWLGESFQWGGVVFSKVGRLCNGHHT